MYGKCLIDTNKINKLQLYYYFYFIIFINYFIIITICILGLKAVDQGQGTEVLVSCVFWYVLQHYRVMPETWER